jgi:LacI family transcriptional regulator
MTTGRSGSGRVDRSKRYASLKEVAARAGVSFQTASKVLNGDGTVRVSAQTAERILAAARELGYSPNTVARSLVRRSTRTLGLVAGDMADGALARFAVAAEREARGHGHAVLVGNLGPGGEDGAEVVRMLIERRVDGLIAAAPQLEDDLEVAELMRSRIPTVSLHHVPGGGVPVVGSNHQHTARLATEHLIGLGHRRIGVVAGPLRRRVVRSRLRGYEDTLRESGLEPEEDLVVEADWSAGGAASATRLLLERERALTAVFVHSDAMAIGVLSALAAAGRRVPADVAVVGCDDMPFAEYLTPALTSVHVPFVETGQEAVRLLLRRIAEQDVPTEPVLLPVELKVRDSCGGRLARQDGSEDLGGST